MSGAVVIGNTIDQVNSDVKQIKKRFSARLFYILTQILPFSVIFLIFAGSLVTSHDAGLSVPDWPTTYGQNMFLYPVSKWQGGIFYEHGHRLIASGVGFLTLILAIMSSFIEKRKAVRIVVFVGLLAVILQGILGGLTVRYLLPRIISVSHALLAQTFLLISITIAYFQSLEFKEKKLNLNINKKTIIIFSIFVLTCLYVQLFLGAYMRHSHAGLAIPDFPTMAGSYWPSFDNSMLSFINIKLKELGKNTVEINQVLIHFYHRLGAMLVVISISLLSFFSFKYLRSNKAILKHNVFIILLVLIQFTLGIFTVLKLKHPLLASLHVVTGALLLGSVYLLFLRICFAGNQVPTKQN